RPETADFCLPCAMRHAPCAMRHAPCAMRHAACGMRHAACGLRPAACGGSGAASMQPCDHPGSLIVGLLAGRESTNVVPPVGQQLVGERTRFAGGVYAAAIV